MITEILESKELPTLPNVASRLIQLTAREDTTLEDIGELVSQDIALSTKILKICNSSFYGFSQQIGSINQAVTILGMNAVRSLVLSFSFLSMNRKKKKSIFNFTRFWEKSLASAVAAQFILKHVKNADSDDVFISGLLQNLGELILATTFPDRYEKVLQQLEKGGSQQETEMEIFGMTNAEVGAAVAVHWGFPDILSLPIKYHDDPRGYKGSDKKIKQTTAAVYLADLLSSILFAEDNPQEFHKQFRLEASRLLKLKPEDIEDILENIHMLYAEAGGYFDLKIQNTKSVQEILQEANIRLSLINLDYDQMNKELVFAKVRLEKLMQELEEKNRILANLANIDGLTGVFNHRYFQNSLEQEIERATRTETSIALLLIDIDHFKKFNDTYGHQTGDFILVEFARVLEKNLRKYDILSRYGGEEFVILLPDTDAETGMIVAEKLRNIIEEHTFTENDTEYHVTASFGVSAGRPTAEDNFSKGDFIGRADSALYSAKEAGRNQVALYSAAKKKKWFSF